MLELFEIKIEDDWIRSKRQKVAEAFNRESNHIKNGNIEIISNQDLRLLFDLYDEIFLNDWFRNNYEGKMAFSLSKRMTKSAGATICPKNIHKIKPKDLKLEIRMGINFFFNYDSLQKDKMVSGIRTKNSLEAMQIVFEHEICHAIEFIYFNRSSCKGKRFKNLAFNLFGHTESYHRLPSNKQIALEKLGLKIGDAVSFELDGKKTAGIISNINKRATVMVRDKKGDYRDAKGVRYSKYYVPLQLLK
ncbi:MAG: hypothetical protein MJA31_19650 [Clostridia bacterium]|nr:hypothetical protein [Clostridia bacterium]